MTMMCHIFGFVVWNHAGEKFLQRAAAPLRTGERGRFFTRFVALLEVLVQYQIH
jgi:hypothetical protein